MTFLKAAESVLKETKRPMRPEEIVKLAIEKGWLSSGGKTPEATMNAQLAVHVKKGGKVFVRAMEAEPELKISGGKLQNWKDLLNYMNKHTDREIYTLPYCCEHSFRACEGGFSSWMVLKSYAYEHRKLLPA